MCTLILLNRMHPRFPMIVAANRDEFFVRESEPPHIFDAGPGVRVLAGRDRLGGGTWLGVNRFGLLAAVTNRRNPAGRDPSRLSRGRLVLDCLACESAGEAESRLDRTDWDAYNPFNLLVVDADRALACTNAGDARKIAPGRGPFAIANGDLGDRKAPEIVRAESAVADLPGEGQALVDHLQLACRSHEGAENDPLQAMCVHLEVYGTVSSTIMLLAGASEEAGEEWPGRYLHCEGPPCKGRYEDLSGLFRKLMAGS